MDNSPPQDGAMYLKRTALPVFSIVVYLITWVANCECYQGIANGFITTVPYDKPAYLTWNAYCFMLISFVFVYPYARWYKGCTMTHYYLHIWPGKLGFQKSCLASFAMMYNLIILNILWVYGLVNISVAAANAVNQTQTAITVALSVLVLGDRFLFSEGLGVFISLFGVFLIVVPPLFDPTDETVQDGSQMFGVVTSIVSSGFWAIYQLSWRILSEAKHRDELTRLEGLVDTLATLSVMGLCNLLVGWPFVVIFHWTGLETYQHPTERWALTLNGLVEYSFDVSCSFAIFLTSPVVTAITAPLTIPISFVWDSVMYNEPMNVGFIDVCGVFFILIGVCMVELKPRTFTCDTCDSICASTPNKSSPLISDYAVPDNAFAHQPTASAEKESAHVEALDEYVPQLT